MAKQAQTEQEQDVSVEAGKPEEETAKGSGLWTVTLRSKRRILVVEVVDALHFAWKDCTAVYGRPLLCGI